MNVKNSKQQSAFENFARQVALAISAVLKNNITLIEQLTNTMEPNSNIQSSSVTLTKTNSSKFVSSSGIGSATTQ
jgi:hypothetical protein